MLALSLAFAITFPAVVSLAPTHPLLHASPTAQQIVPQVPSLVPYGTASGTWFQPTLLNGALTALLVDADGLPLFVLDAQMSSSNQISGRLLALEYAGNPALSQPQLSVIGQARFPAEGPGRFSLVIYNPLEDFGYVYPHGRIEGVLQHGLRPVPQHGLAAETHAPSSQADAGASELAHSSVPTADIARTVQGATVSVLIPAVHPSAAEQKGQAVNGQASPTPIVCPWYPYAGAGRVFARWTLAP